MLHAVEMSDISMPSSGDDSLGILGYGGRSIRVQVLEVLSAHMPGQSNSMLSQGSSSMLAPGRNLFSSRCSPTYRHEDSHKL